ncbi:MAG: nuclear transport factor 2 family protein, partial [Pseudomonadota bacterium]
MTETAKRLCDTYLEALQLGDLDKVANLFTRDGVVHSPLYGTLPARAFYEGLFAVTNRSETALKRVLTNDEPGDSAIGLHFVYRWTLADGTPVTFEVVDIIEVEEGTGLFKALTILYDTAPLREAHA